MKLKAPGHGYTGRGIPVWKFCSYMKVMHCPNEYVLLLSICLQQILLAWAKLHPNMISGFQFRPGLHPASLECRQNELHPFVPIYVNVP